MWKFFSVPGSRPLSLGWGRRRRKKVNSRRVSQTALLIRNFLFSFIQSFRAKLVSHGFLLDRMGIYRWIIVRKFHKLNNHMHRMFSWINVRQEEEHLPRTSGLLPQLVWMLWVTPWRQKWHAYQMFRGHGAGGFSQYTQQQSVDLRRSWGAGGVSPNQEGLHEDLKPQGYIRYMLEAQIQVAH